MGKTKYTFGIYNLLYDTITIHPECSTTIQEVENIIKEATENLLDERYGCNQLFVENLQGSNILISQEYLCEKVFISHNKYLIIHKANGIIDLAEREINTGFISRFLVEDKTTKLFKIFIIQFQV